MIAAVLDWEFASPDMRAMDVAILLEGWTWPYRSADPDLTIFAALCEGIASTHSFTAEEVAALPDLMRLHTLVVLLRFLGREREGLDAQGAYLGRVSDLFTLDDWLKTHGTTLLRHMYEWFKVTP